MTFFDSFLNKHGYTLGDFVGKGATADCFIVVHHQFPNKQFVCKVIDPFPEDMRKTLVKTVQNEIDLLSHIDHANIIRFYDFFEEKGVLFLILEYCSHGQLTSEILNNLMKDNVKVLNYSVQLADALTYLHFHGIAHLDIKPANIFITEYNKIKLSDFGVSVQISHGEKISHKVGSKFFRAPETYSKPYDPFKADIFSLGVTFLSMAKRDFFMNLPHTHDYYQVLMEETENLGEYGKLIRDCINLEPEKRPDARQVLDRLHAFGAFQKTAQQSRSCGSLRHVLGFSPKIVKPTQKTKITLKPENLMMLRNMSSPLIKLDL